MLFSENKDVDHLSFEQLLPGDRQRHSPGADGVEMLLLLLDEVVVRYLGPLRQVYGHRDGGLKEVDHFCHPGNLPVNGNSDLPRCLNSAPL